MKAIILAIMFVAFVSLACGSGSQPTATEYLPILIMTRNAQLGQLTETAVKGGWTVLPSYTPRFTPSQTYTPLPTNTPRPTATISKSGILLSNISTFNSDGDLVILGEAKNTGNVPLKNAEVIATLYDNNGNVLDTDTSSVWVPLEFSFWFDGILYPSEQAPFRILFESPGSWSKYKTSIEYEVAKASDYSDHYRDLLVINDTGREFDGFLGNYKVSGEIKNTGYQTCGPVRIVISLYNNEGKIVGFDYLGMTEDEEITPGEIAPFSVEVYSRGTVASYSILVEAIKK